MTLPYEDRNTGYLTSTLCMGMGKANDGRSNVLRLRIQLTMAWSHIPNSRGNLEGADEEREMMGRKVSVGFSEERKGSSHPLALSLGSP
eukprot:1404687-Rhodomonas_salina.4